MGRTLLGVLLAALAVFFWGFIYWGVNSFPYTAWKQAPDDVAAQIALLEHFPEDGTYHVPAIVNTEARLTELYAKGPVAFVHITSRLGRPLHDTTPMIRGFVLYLAVAAILAALVRRLPSADTLENVKRGALAGLVSAVMIDIGDSVWWYLGFEWKLVTELYHFTSWTLMAVILGKYVTRKEDIHETGV